MLERFPQSLKPPLRQLFTLARSVGQHVQWGTVNAGHPTLLSRRLGRRRDALLARLAEAEQAFPLLASAPHSRPALPGMITPSAAAKNTRSAVPIDPRAAVRWSALIIEMILIQTPLPDIAMHVVKTKSVGR